MKAFPFLCVAAVFATFALGSSVPAKANDAIKEQSFQALHHMKMSVKMIGLAAQTTDLQIVCVFKHKAGGDKLIDAIMDFDDKRGGLLQAVRERGEFVGELGETFLFLPPAGAITPKQVLLIGLGDEKDLNVDALKCVGRVAVREAVRLRAAHVSFAPTIRDQGNNTIDVGDGDQAVAENVISAYDTEKRLQDQGLAAPFRIEDWTIEAGPAFFAVAVTKVGQGITAASSALGSRAAQPYVLTTR